MRERGGVWIAHGAGSADRDVVDERNSVEVPPDAPAYRLRRLWLSPEEEERLLRRILQQRPVAALSPGARASGVQGRGLGGVSSRSIGCSPKRSRIEAPPDSSVFLNDYHLALVAKYLRERRPLLRTALFWHIPWPDVGSAAHLSVAQGDPRGAAQQRPAGLPAAARSAQLPDVGERRARRLGVRRDRLLRRPAGARRRDSDRRRFRSHHDDPRRRRTFAARCGACRASSGSRARSSASASIGSTTPRAFPSASRRSSACLRERPELARSFRVRPDRRAVAERRARLCRDLGRNRRAGRARQHDLRRRSRTRPDPLRQAGVPAAGAGRALSARATSASSRRSTTA